MTEEIAAQAEIAEFCMLCHKYGPVNFECAHPDAHTPVPNLYQDANGEEFGDDLTNRNVRELFLEAFSNADQDAMGPAFDRWLLGNLSDAWERGRSDSLDIKWNGTYYVPISKKAENPYAW